MSLAEIAYTAAIGAGLAMMAVPSAVNLVRAYRQRRRSEDMRRAFEIHTPSTENEANTLRASPRQSNARTIRSLFGASGTDPSDIPDDAKSAKWESRHLFSPFGKLPERHSFGISCPEPPLAMICPECDLKQPALNHGDRECEYCGVTMMVHGTRLYWWRCEAVEPELWTGRAA